MLQGDRKGELGCRLHHATRLEKKKWLISYRIVTQIATSPLPFFPVVNIKNVQRLFKHRFDKNRVHPSKPLLSPPLILPSRKPRALHQRPHFPSLLHHPLLLLLSRPSIQCRNRNMLHVPRILVLHHARLALSQNLRAQRRHIRLVAEFRNRREERFEVEDDGARQRHPAQGLPVHAKMDPGQFERRGLTQAVGLMRVTGGHEERRVNFQTPGATLYRTRSRDFGEVAKKEEKVLTKGHY